MSTESITRQEVIETDEQADKLIEALEKSKREQIRNKHKYLKEIFEYDEDFSYPFNELDYPAKNDEYGFDTRETYEFYFFMITWLYERLRYFQDVTSKTIDITFHKFDVNGEEFTQKQCIDKMVEDCKIILLEDESWDRQYYKKIDAAKDDLFMILSKVFWTMWW